VFIAVTDQLNAPQFRRGKIVVKMARLYFGRWQGANYENSRFVDKSQEIEAVVHPQGDERTGLKKGAEISPFLIVKI